MIPNVQIWSNPSENKRVRLFSPQKNRILSTIIFFASKKLFHKNYFVIYL